MKKQKTVKTHIKEETWPSCTTKAGFQYWLEAVKAAPSPPRHFCEDCTIEYELSMTLAARCDKAAWIRYQQERQEQKKKQKTRVKKK